MKSLRMISLFAMYLATGCRGQASETPDFSGVKIGMTKEQIPAKYTISECKPPTFGTLYDKEIGIEDLLCEKSHDNVYDVHFLFFNKKLIGMYGYFTTRLEDRDAVHTAIMNKFGKHFETFSLSLANDDREVAGTCFGIENCKGWHWIEKGNFEFRYSAESGGTTPLRFALFDHSQDSKINDLRENAKSQKAAETKKKADALGF